MRWTRIGILHPRQVEPHPQVHVCIRHQPPAYSAAKREAQGGAIHLEDPISQWIGRLKQKDPRAVELIWREYFDKMVRRARTKLGELPRREQDEEDIALSAMHSFIRGVDNQRFPKLDDRDDLWRILLTITVRKVHQQRRRQFADKRGGGAVRGESVFQHADDAMLAGLDEVLGKEPSPELSAEFLEIIGNMLRDLGDPALERIVLQKLEGRTNAEIALQLQCAVRTVERKLELIRERWQKIEPTMS